MNNQMKISEIQIIPVNETEGLIAFCSFVLNDSIKFNSVAIYTKLDGGYRLVYPTKLLSEKKIPLFYPISNDVGKYIENKIVSHFENLMKKHDMYYGNRNPSN